MGRFRTRTSNVVRFRPRQPWEPRRRDGMASVVPRRAGGRRRPRQHLLRVARFALYALVYGAFIFQGNEFRKAAFPVGELAGNVARVVDGDTLHIVGYDRPVRLWGVDAPETGTPGGAAATAELRRIAEGQALRCDEITRDRYGRVVARCYRQEGRDISEIMIDSGKAQEYWRYTGGWYAIKKLREKLRGEKRRRTGVDPGPRPDRGDRGRNPP